MERITSRENKLVKEYGKLLNSKSYRDKTGRFVVESRKLVEEAYQSGVKLEKVFVTQSGFEKSQAALQKLFEEEKGTFFYEITEDLEKKLTQTGNAQGIFAVCKKLDKPMNLNTIKNGAKYIFLSELQDTGNVGTIIRTADALGLDGVILGKNTCDVFSLKVLRSSMGSVFHIDLYQSEDPVEDLRRLSQSFETYAAVLDEQAKSLEEISFEKGSIAVIGNEGNGLSKEVIDACSQKVFIPMKGRAESFNAGVAAGILIWEMAK